jgi:hypothetical protein
MPRSEKAEMLTAITFRVKPLLIRCNFCGNSVSNIAERSGSSLHYAYGSEHKAR